MTPFQKVDGQVLRSAREYDIAAATSIKAGAVVKLSAGLVVAAGAGETGQILGVAAEDHTSGAGPFNPRADAKKILVYDDPMQIFQCPVPVVAATGGFTAASPDDLHQTCTQRPPGLRPLTRKVFSSRRRSDMSPSTSERLRVTPANAHIIGFGCAASFVW